MLFHLPDTFQYVVHSMENIHDRIHVFIRQREIKPPHLYPKNNMDCITDLKPDEILPKQLRNCSVEHLLKFRQFRKIRKLLPVDIVQFCRDVFRLIRKKFPNIIHIVIVFRILLIVFRIIFLDEASLRLFTPLKDFTNLPPEIRINATIFCNPGIPSLIRWRTAKPSLQISAMSVRCGFCDNRHANRNHPNHSDNAPKTQDAFCHNTFETNSLTTSKEEA